MICWAYTISNPDLTNQIFLNQFFAAMFPIWSRYLIVSAIILFFFSWSQWDQSLLGVTFKLFYFSYTIPIHIFYTSEWTIIKSLLILQRNKNQNATSKSFWTHCTWVEYKQSCIFKPKHSWIRTSSQIRTSWIEQLCYVNNESAKKMDLT